MSDFLALEELEAADLNDHFDDDRDRLSDLESLTTVEDVENTTGTTTSVTYTSTLTGGTACGLAFVAPPSGKVLIHNNSRIFNSGSNLSLCSIHVRNGASIGSGTDFLAAADAHAISYFGANDDRRGGTELVTGLTPGNNYNVIQSFKVTGGTGSFGNKSLIVQKVL